jgi:hypothetical protein
MESARRFLDRHPEIEGWKERSTSWPRIKEQNVLHGLDQTLYQVQGDILGDEDDLLVDALARGAADQSPDPLAREFFQELPPDLQQIVRRELLNTGNEGGQE